MMRAYLARQYAKLYPREMLIAVSGSVGKTATLRAGLAVLSQKFKTISTEPGLDSSISIPKTVLKINPTVRKVLLEMGVKNRGEMDFYLSLAKPKTVVITRISYENAESLGGINEILQEQGKLIESLDSDGVAILNGDDPNSKKLASLCKGKVYYFGFNQECLVWAGNLKIENFRTTFELNLGVERVKVNFSLLGAHQVYSALAAAALGVVFDIPLTKIKIALESIEPTEHSSQIVLGPSGSIIIDDTSNSSPASLDASIDTLLQIPASRRMIVLGEMRHLGKYSENLHRAVAQKIYKEKLDFVFLTPGDTEFIADELKSLGFWEERLEVNLQNSKIVGKLLKLLGKGDVCLITGSKEIRLDEVVKRVSKKN